MAAPMFLRIKRSIRQELFEEIETVIQSFYPDLAFFLELPPFQKLHFLIGDFDSSFTELGFLLDNFSKKKPVYNMIKVRAMCIESCVDDQELAKYFISLILYVIFLFYL